jgi:hypothetical protein
MGIVCRVFRLRTFTAPRAKTPIFEMATQLLVKTYERSLLPRENVLFVEERWFLEAPEG